MLDVVESTTVCAGCCVVDGCVCVSPGGKIGERVVSMMITTLINA